MSESSNEPFDAVAAFESYLSDSPGTTESREEHETDEAEADEAEAHDEPEDDASEESDAEGESNEDDADDGEDLEDDVLVTVKIDGKSEKIALKELRAGYSRQSSYTQKTQALAEERKAFQAEQELIRQERAQYAVLLDKLGQQFNDVQEPNWEYVRQNYDPQTYLMAREEWRDLQERRAVIQEQQQRLAKEEQTAQVAQFVATVAQEKELLFTKHPELRNEKVWAKVQKEIRQYGREVVGFSEEELNAAADHRAVSTLYEGLKSHKAKTAKGEPIRSTGKRVQPGSTTATPRKPNAFEAANKRLQSSGKLSDAADALRHLI